LERKIALLGTSVLGFLSTFGLFVVSPILPQYVEKYGVTYAEIGAFFSAYSLTWALLEMFTGHLCDKYGKKRLGSLGLATYGASALLCGVAQTFFQLVVFRVIQGIGLGIFGPAVLGLIAQMGEKSKSFSIYRTFQGFGMMIAPILGGILGSLNLSYPFFLSALVSAAGIPTMILISEKKTVAARETFRHSIRNLLSRYSVVMVCLAVFLVEIGFAGFELVIPLIGSSEGFSNVTIGLILSSYFVTFLLFQIPLGVVFEKWRGRFLAAFFALSCVPPFFLLYISKNPVLMAVWMGWLGVTLGAVFVQSGAMIAKSAPSGMESLYMAFFDGVIDLSFPAMPILVTPLLGVDLRSPFLLFALLTSFSTFLLFFQSRERRIPGTEL